MLLLELPFFKKKTYIVKLYVVQTYSQYCFLTDNRSCYFASFLIVIFYGELFWGHQLLRGIFVLTVGLAFVVFGLILLIYTISLFILYGNGTIAPWHPTKHLIKSGIYGCVRNPIIIGVFLILIGESFVCARA